MVLKLNHIECRTGKQIMKRINIKKLVILLFICLLCGCAGKKETLRITDVEQLKEKRIGIVTGTIYDAIVKEEFPDAEYYYFNTITDLCSALLSHKVDAIAQDENVLRESIKSNPEITMIGKPLIEIPIAFAFPKNEEGDQLLKQMNDFLMEERENGTLNELEEKWTNFDETTEVLHYTKLPDTNGTLKLATDPCVTPYSMVINGRIVGYEIEIAALFCEKYGCRLEVVNTNFGGMVSGVQSGKTNFAVGDLGVTEERKQSVNFSEPTALVYGRIAVLGESETESAPFIKKLTESLDKTFIRENRWLLFVKGIATTLLITVLSLLLGTLFGFLAYLQARRKFAGLFAKCCDFMIWLIHGMPTVVLLMILYYIIFGSTSLSSVFVAVICFTLSFACSMYGMLKSGEKAVDKGQKEAAFTLGFTEAETFSKIILPQAAYHFLPNYKAEIVSLIKATAVVGYIAVQDITKVGDIVRSRTYEAFFPLIMTAVMYYVMSFILTAVVNRIDFVIDPEKRDKNRMLKGVHQHD